MDCFIISSASVASPWGSSANDCSYWDFEMHGTWDWRPVFNLLLDYVVSSFFLVWTCRYWPSSAYRFCFFLAELVGFLFPVNWKFLITLPLQAGRDILVFEIALHYSVVEILLFILYYPDPFSAKDFALGGEERGVQFSEFAFIIAMCSSLESLNSPMMA